MSRQVGIGLGPDRRPVAVKRTYSPNAAARLAREVAMLREAEHPGVVRVIAYQPAGDDGQAMLTTGWVAGGNFGAAAERRPLIGLVATLASAATTVADLHERRMVHARLGPDHVLVDGDGRAVLTGFAEAEHRGHGVVRRTSGLASSDDVAALGRMAIELSERGRAARRTHPGEWLRRRRTGAELLEQLHQIGTRAADPMATRRPSARALARQLEALTPPAAPRSARARVRTLGPVLAAAVLLAAAATFLVTRLGTDQRTAPAETAVAATTIAPTTIASATTWTSSPAPTDPCPQPGGAAVDLDGDGCPESITTDADGLLRVGAVTYRIGVDGGDIVLAGDWDCDGEATVAVVRMPSGAIDVFDGWPGAGTAPTAARRVRAVPGATSAEARRRLGTHCDDLAVTSADGSTTIVALTAPP